MSPYVTWRNRHETALIKLTREENVTRPAPGERMNGMRLDSQTYCVLANMMQLNTTQVHKVSSVHCMHMYSYLHSFVGQPHYETNKLAFRRE